MERNSFEHAPSEKSIYEDSININGKIIKSDDKVKVLRSNGKIEEGWVFVNLNTEDNRILVRKFDGRGNNPISKRVFLDDFIKWQSEE